MYSSPHIRWSRSSEHHCECFCSSYADSDQTRASACLNEAVIDELRTQAKTCWKNQVFCLGNDGSDRSLMKPPLAYVSFLQWHERNRCRWTWNVWMRRNIISMKSVCSCNVCKTCGDSGTVFNGIFLDRGSWMKGTNTTKFQRGSIPKKHNLKKSDIFKSSEWILPIWS